MASFYGPTRFMKLTIHEKAQDAYNEEGERLLALVQSTPSKLPTEPLPPEGSERFYPAAVIDIDQMENVVEFATVPGTGVVSKRKRFGSLVHGFDEEGYRALRLLAEKIQRAKGVRERVSAKAMEEAVLDWAVDRHLARTDQALCQRLVEEFESRIKERWMWVAAYGVFSEYDFELGRTVVHPFRAAFFEAWEAALRKRGAWEDERAQAFVTEARTKLQGHMACTIRVEAEPTRAREVAREEAENALAMLRLFLPSIAHPLVPSYCKPRGLEEVEFSTVLVIEGDEVVGYNEDHGSVETWDLDSDLLDDARQLGLGTLHGLYLKEGKSEFEKDLLRSLFTFSRSSLQKDPSDRLVYVFRALDSFLLQSKTENIQQNTADRIAFTVADDPRRRQEVVALVKKAYGMRSDVVHHDQTIEETETIAEFLQTVHTFYMWLLARHADHATRKDFFDAVEAKKYS